MMKTGDKGIALIKKWEGFRSMPYKDVVGKWTVGYGHLMVPGDGCVVGSPITMGQATTLLQRDLTTAELGVNTSVKVPITQNQFDALVCFTYNLGVAALQSSTLLKLVNQKKFTEAVDQFKLWNHAGGVVVDGLTTRRKEEAQLFMES